MKPLDGSISFVGRNDTGKTSLLEAIYLLAHQNDERALINTICWRSRRDRDPPPIWLVNQIPSLVSISGQFDRVDHNEAHVSFGVTTEPEPDVEDQTSFLSKLLIDSRYENREQNTEVVFFGDRPRRTQYQGQHWLCRSALTSPFSANRPETLARCNRESLEAGTKGEIIKFIRERIDPKLRNIELADKFNRFLVTHVDFEKAPDLATFGEGVRRVFEIGLLFCRCPRGSASCRRVRECDSHRTPKGVRRSCSRSRKRTERSSLSVDPIARRLSTPSFSTELKSKMLSAMRLAEPAIPSRQVATLETSFAGFTKPLTSI